jgi:hypothetical protein
MNGYKEYVMIRGQYLRKGKRKDARKRNQTWGRVRNEEKSRKGTK